MPKQASELYEALRSFIYSLGYDITELRRQHYIAFRRMKNIVCVANFEDHDPQLRLWLNILPESCDLEDGFTRDVTNVMHPGTGNLEVVLRSQTDLNRAKGLILKGYEGTDSAE